MKIRNEKDIKYKLSGERKVCFAIYEEQYQRVKALPRDVNLSHELRKSLDKILDRYK